jgi:hypothetical protein
MPPGNLTVKRMSSALMGMAGKWQAQGRLDTALTGDPIGICNDAVRRLCSDMLLANA